MVFYEVYVMCGTTANTVLITQSKENAVRLAHQLQLEDKPAFWEKKEMN